MTVSVCKKNIEDARAYFARTGAELTARFAALGAKATELDATEKLCVLHDFYRSGSEAGCGLMRYGSALVPFVNRFPANTELYKLITTKPREGLFAKGRVDDYA